MRDRSRAIGRRLRAITRTIRRRSGEAKSEVLRLVHGHRRGVGALGQGARRLAQVARGKARGRGAKAKLKAAANPWRSWRIEYRRSPGRSSSGSRASRSRIGSCRCSTRTSGRSARGSWEAQRVRVRVAVGRGDRHAERGARGLILPASTEIGNPAEDTLLPQTVAELERLGIRVQEVAVDGGFNTGPTNTALADLQPKQTFIAGRQEPPPDAHNDGCGAAERAPRAGSVTLNAAGLGPDAASKATRAGRSGLSGRSSPTTPTRSPSGSSETCQPLLRQEQNPITTNGHARDHSAVVSYLTSFSAASN